MKSRNALVEQYAKEAAEEIREAEARPDDKRTPRLLIENAMWRLLTDVDILSASPSSELLRSLQGRMVKSK